ncbi:long-chain-fatty-acid--CoA ligase [Iodidimonas sp. SYSU 1G8]|uniref:long-chain-fatty-acid--CoA ligase n=1 Tax=Iodidimonas sp. SYSU 1G8 TaxID=3133967 RepID=UPI0031FE7006
MLLSLGLRRTAQLRGHHAAIIEPGRQLNWTEVESRVARFASALRGLGVRTGDRVAVMADNAGWHIEAYFAIPWAGAAIAPVNTRWALPEIIDSLNDCAPRVLIVDDAHLPLLGGVLAGAPSIETVITTGAGAASGAHDLETLIAMARPMPPEPVDKDQLAGIFYTGGTTGRSKGVMLSQNNLYMHSLMMIAEDMFHADSVGLHVAPMFHLADVGTVMGVTMAGGSHVCLPRFEPAATLRAIQDHGVTEVYLVSTMLRAVLDDPGFDEYDLTSLRGMIYGASPIAEALLTRALEKIPTAGFMQRYGMTETTGFMTLLKPPFQVVGGAKLRSAGQPIHGVDVRVVDAHGDEVPRGTIGEVAASGPTIMLGYWGRPEETAQALRGGRMFTGDLGHMDEDGFLFIADRLKDMIISGGENIYSGEVENALYRHPAVAQCAVIGVPSEKWGEAVHAVIVPRDGHDVTAEALGAHCRSLIAAYKCPKSYEFRTEPLPLTGAGKVRKYSLREPYRNAAH